MGTTTDTGATGAGDGKGAAVGLSGAEGDAAVSPLAAPPASGADLAAEYEARLRGRIQGLQAKFANMRAHLVHGANGDVRAVAHAMTALVDLLEAEIIDARALGH